MPLPVSENSLAQLRMVDENEQMIDQVPGEKVFEEMFRVLDVKGQDSITKEDLEVAVRCMGASTGLDELLDELAPDPAGLLNL